jgi:hypothetical protein
MPFTGCEFQAEKKKEYTDLCCKQKIFTVKLTGSGRDVYDPLAAQKCFHFNI